MRGIMKVVIGGLIVLAIIVVAALALNSLLSRGPRISHGGAATYYFAKSGFVVTYSRTLLRVEIDPQWPGAKDNGPVYFCSRLGPKVSGPQGARTLPDSRDWINVEIIALGNDGPPRRPLAAVIRDWLAGRRFGATSDVRYHRTRVNGMPGVAYDATVNGTRFATYLLCAHGYEVRTMAVAASSASPSVWSAFNGVVQSVRAWRRIP